MNEQSEAEIRERAYQLWKAAGEPTGKADDFLVSSRAGADDRKTDRGDLPPGMTDNLPV
jgi:hypothetical protein